ncbi:MAG: hypothetical protein ACSHXL_00870 [Bacteroidota bacterium]
MQSNNFFKYLIAGVVLLVVMNLMSSALFARTSSISVIVKWLGVICAVWCLSNIKHGIYIIIGEAFLTDFLKKLAVYYGSVSQVTIIEVMAVVMLAVVCCFARKLLDMITAKGKVNKLEFTLYVFFAMWTILIFVKESGNGFVGAGQSAFNGGLYLGIAPLVFASFNKEEYIKLIKFMFFMGLIWAVVSIKQRWIGFSDIEWFYSETGLSKVSSNQMLLARYGDTPRTFGLGSGLPNYTAMAPFTALAIYFAVTAKYVVNKIYYVFAAILIFYSVICSQGKTAILLAVMIPVFALMMSQKITRIPLILTSLLTVVATIVFSEIILENLEEFSGNLLDFFNLSGSWSIRTYGDRLVAFIELKNMDNWTAFGQRDFDRVHSSIVNTLLLVGYVPLALGMVVVLYIGRWLYLRLANTPKSLMWSASTFLCASSLIFFVANLNGDGMYSQPVGLVVGILFGGFLIFSEKKVSLPSGEVEV